MSPRNLQFDNFEAVCAELDRLRANGYLTAGKWNLAQIAAHLEHFAAGPMDGWSFRVPWLVKILFGRSALRRTLSRKRMPVGFYTPYAPTEAEAGSETDAVDRLKSTLRRLATHAGPWHASPFFGTLTADQWRELNLIHCAHHLGFLLPKENDEMPAKT